MKSLPGPVIRITLVITVVAMLFFLPAREFLKITLWMAVPAIFILGYMKNARRYSPGWIVGLLLLIVIGAGYGYMLVDLPDRIEARRIIIEGSQLVNEGRYDEAIALYRGLGEVGREEKMQQKIEEARTEAEASQILEQARILHEEGNPQRALELVKDIPPGTRAAAEAEKLKKEIEE